MVCVKLYTFKFDVYFEVNVHASNLLASWIITNKAHVSVQKKYK
jgi:hypothetical protein